MENKLKHIITKQFGVLEEKVNKDTDIIADLNADSLDLMELVIAIETTFSITIEENEYRDCHTVGRILELIKSKVE
jgi:acyl carrier protein